MIITRNATPGDRMDFAKLILLSAPYFPYLFGNNIKTILQEIFFSPRNLFSYEHVYFTESNGEKSGMILGYDTQAKKRENLNTGMLLFNKIGFGIFRRIIPLLRFNSPVGKMSKGDFYISNIAVYPKFREMGLGKKLLYTVEHKANQIKCERIILDVEKENQAAANFYINSGYKKMKEFSILLHKDRILHFYRMVKEF